MVCGIRIFSWRTWDPSLPCCYTRRNWSHLKILVSLANYLRRDVGKIAIEPLSRNHWVMDLKRSLDNLKAGLRARLEVEAWLKFAIATWVPNTSCGQAKKPHHAGTRKAETWRWGILTQKYLAYRIKISLLFTIACSLKKGRERNDWIQSVRSFYSSSRVRSSPYGKWFCYVNSTGLMHS